MEKQNQADFFAYQLQFQQPSDVIRRKYPDPLRENQAQAQVINIQGNNAMPLAEGAENTVNPLSPMFLYDFAHVTTLSDSIQPSMPTKGHAAIDNTKLYSGISNTVFTDPNTPESGSYSNSIPINMDKNAGTSARTTNFLASPFTFDNDAANLASSLNSRARQINTQLQNAERMNMFPPLFDDNNDFSPENSYRQSALTPNINDFNLGNNHSNSLVQGIDIENLNRNPEAGFPITQHQRFIEMQNIVSSSPVNTSYYSSSLPTNSQWDRNSALFDATGLQKVIEDSPYFGSINTNRNSGAPFSPGSAINGSIDMRDTGTDFRRSSALNDKRRRRRESHNAVERRRRDNINDQIQELYNLLPHHLKDPNIKPNKGLILSKSVTYIKELKGLASKTHNTQENNTEIYPSGIALSQAHNNTGSGLASILSNKNEMRNTSNSSPSV